MNFLNKINSIFFNLIFEYKNNKYLREFENFKNIHLGESCYIFGDGPSIKSYDLKNFSKKKSIIVGYLFAHKEFKSLNCRYSILLEPAYFNFILIILKKFFIFLRFEKNIFKTIFFRISIIKFFKKQISTNKNIIFFINIINFFMKKNKRICFISNKLNLTLNEHFKLKKNEINFLKSSLRFSISLASYMGFKKVYLVGFDYL